MLRDSGRGGSAGDAAEAVAVGVAADAVDVAAAEYNLSMSRSHSEGSDAACYIPGVLEVAPARSHGLGGDAMIV